MATARTPMSLTGGLFMVPPVRRAGLAEVVLTHDVVGPGTGGTHQLSGWTAPNGSDRWRLGAAR